jgi:hypothetical protein
LVIPVNFFFSKEKEKEKLIKLKNQRFFNFVKNVLIPGSIDITLFDVLFFCSIFMMLKHHTLIVQYLQVLIMRIRYFYIIIDNHV